ncbi:MAG TPA: HEAT repeat domain-containing protein [Candidatus Polarisedimenticolia bacterium]|nr:HEAT repeat domain-containing protein [Candidatus Polarisedimenticolia bacterium]
MRTGTGTAVWLALAVAAVSPSQARQQAPRITGTVESREASRGLAAEIAALARRDGASWVGWTAPMVAGERSMCCFESWDSRPKGRRGSCRLEKQESFTVNTFDDHAVKLEGDDTFLVMARLKDGEVSRVRAFTMDCVLDAGGRPVTWLTGVPPAESLSWLGSLAGAEPGRRARDEVAGEATMAIAMHRGEGADRLLASLAEGAADPQAREQAIFWIGSARGRAGYEALRRILKDERSEEMRKKAIFALTQNETPGALEEIVRAAKTDLSAVVRGEAIFWLSQKAGERAAEAITEAIENDPETEVKKKAVFALSQLPAEEGVPRLIELARSHSNAAVRKEAMFWLGQSGDPRALAFFEEILNG